LVRLVWNFDVELCGESERWAERQRAYYRGRYFCEKKGPLWVKLKAVGRMGKGYVKKSL